LTKSTYTANSSKVRAPGVRMYLRPMYLDCTGTAGHGLQESYFIARITGRGGFPFIWRHGFHAHATVP
jgi:hypothetical protein